MKMGRSKKKENTEFHVLLGACRGNIGIYADPSLFFA
jgi:hypothetical protein